MAYLLDETASMASSDSDNADRIDAGRLPSGMRSFQGHVHTRQCFIDTDYGSGILLLKPVS